MGKIATLQLVVEHKLYELLPSCTAETRLEASGVEAVDGHFLVVLDNLRQLARIPFRRRPLMLEAGQFVGRLERTGFEDLAVDRRRNRLLLLHEAVRHERGYQAELVEWDQQFDALGQARLDFDFSQANKGFEGLAWTRNGGRDEVFAICEGNHCRCGRKGRTPGGGRIQVFVRSKDRWRHRRELELPREVPFEDYAGLAVAGDRVGVVSQASSMLWVGRLSDDHRSWRDAGRLYEFPRSRKGRKLYCTVEGIAWLGPRRIVVVSDRRKREQSRRASRKDQSIHIFTLP